MAAKTVRQAVKAAVVAALGTAEMVAAYPILQTLLDDDLIIPSYGMKSLPKMHVRVLTPECAPDIEQGVNIGNYTVSVILAACSQMDAFDDEEHEELCQPLEALHQTNDMAGRLTTLDLSVQGVSDPQPVEEDTYRETMRITSYPIEIYCGLTAAATAE